MIKSRHWRSPLCDFERSKLWVLQRQILFFEPSWVVSISDHTRRDVNGYLNNQREHKDKWKLPVTIQNITQLNLVLWYCFISVYWGKMNSSNPPEEYQSLYICEGSRSSWSWLSQVLDLKAAVLKDVPSLIQETHAGLRYVTSKVQSGGGP